ncbi:MAG: glycosyltransferase [Clostridiales bacterium]|nr:glycosyltransferase [Clostridiales bacterium]
MNTVKAISVIVPVYNVQPYLRRCVDSILAQTFADFDLILVDDGSPDACGAICDEYERLDPRVHALHRNNGGLSAARNTGIEWAQKNSSSEWITFIDSDDWVHPRYLEILLQAVESTGQNVSVGGFERKQREDEIRTLPEIPRINVCNTEEFYCSDKVTATIACGKLYRKADFISIRYPEGKIHEDEFTTYKVLFQYKAIAVVDHPLYLYFQNPQSIMGSGWNPKHMAECDGMLEQLTYFEKNGYKKASEYVSRLYLISLYRNLRSANSEKKYHTEKRKLLRRLKKELIRRGDSSELTLKNAPWIYYEAFPVLTLPLRAWKKLFGKKG